MPIEPTYDQFDMLLQILQVGVWALGFIVGLVAAEV